MVLAEGGMGQPQLAFGMWGAAGHACLVIMAAQEGRAVGGIHICIVVIDRTYQIISARFERRSNIDRGVTTMASPAVPSLDDQYKCHPIGSRS